MLKRRKKRDGGFEEMGAQDTFLDIISNIVGILIILVMIAGIRAQYAPAEKVEETVAQTEQEESKSDCESVNEPATEQLPDVSEQEVQLADEDAHAPSKVKPPPQYADEATIREIESQFEYGQTRENNALNLRRNLDELLMQKEEIALQLERENMERAEILRLIGIARSELEALAGEKDRETKERIELQRQLGELNARLDQLTKTKSWFEANRPQATVLENAPTPIGKTVEEKEVHFRLLDGKITYIPLTELMEKLSLEITGNKNHYFKQKTSTGSIGPIDGFRLDFMTVTYDVMMRDALGSGIGSRLELDYAEFVPVSENIGQPLEEALTTPNSETIRRLQLYRQDIYTVTVWVYPDSFRQFQHLKRFLHEKGYRIAARPLQFGESISGSPRGSKSTSQ